MKGLFAGGAAARTQPDARQVVDALFERSWRIVHVAGHGEPVSEKGDRGGVVLSNDTFLGASEIKAMRVVPELVFVNCCHLARRCCGDRCCASRNAASTIAPRLRRASRRR